MSKRIEELLEEYSSNRKQYTGEKHFKFLKKVFKAFKEVGALNISFIYYTLNSNSPKIMDSEFMKAYIESMLKDNHTLISIFTGYWENNRGLELTEGLNTNFNMIHRRKAF
jgi:2C-methyl-D-erythritol 2,4-cyclodiphosphate synthase